MTNMVLKRQLITDASGNPVGVILPLEEYAAVEKILEQRFPLDVPIRNSDDEKLAQIEQAACDPLFLDDLHETMSAFANVDAEWWEPAR